MDVEKSYFSVAPFFDPWVRVMEIHSRRMEEEDSGHWGSKILIVSPPVDPGIPLLAKANRHGDTVLLCFSERLKRIALNYSMKQETGPPDIRIAPFFSIPCEDGEFAAIYANCFFDFCEEGDFPFILKEMHRALKADGSLFMVYMGLPDETLAKGWAWAFSRFRFLSQGCHPVSMAPHLPAADFELQKDLYANRLGFPLRYTLAKKALPANSSDTGPRT